MKQVKEKETDTQLALDAIQYLPFPGGLEHVKSYTMSGVKYINANYSPVKEATGHGK